MGFRELINKILGELRDWTEKHPDARRTPEEFYLRVARLLRDARRIETAEELEQRVRDIEALVVAEGPVADDFLPSLEELHERVSEATLG